MKSKPTLKIYRHRHGIENLIQKTHGYQQKKIVTVHFLYCHRIKRKENYYA